MTTCAWDGTTLASDTRCTCDIEYVGNESKIFRIDGRLVAGAGATTGIRKFLSWYEKDRRVKTYPTFVEGEDIEMMTITEDGQASLWTRHGLGCKLVAPCAIGSGQRFAIGAMLAGKTAVEAVEIAMQRDTATGGDIEYMTLEQKLGEISA